MTADLCPAKECVQYVPAVSHTFTVRSALAVASMAPEGSTAMPITGALCPCRRVQQALGKGSAGNSLLLVAAALGETICLAQPALHAELIEWACWCQLLLQLPAWQALDIPQADQKPAWLHKALCILVLTSHCMHPQKALTQSCLHCQHRYCQGISSLRSSRLAI